MPTIPDTPDTIGHCIVTGILGEGGMGVVFKARHPELNLDVAVKVLPPQLARHAETKARFVREAQLATKLNHPSVVRVLDNGEDEGLPYIVMEYVDGESLDDRIASLGRLPVAEALRIVRSIADALCSALAQGGLIHRDIKPANVMLTRRGEVKLADLGLAKVISGDKLTKGMTQSGKGMGTPQYMAPEQYEDASKVDHRADMFSLGVTLYEMLTGGRPFDGESIQEIMKRVFFEEPAPIPATVPGGLRAIVLRLLEKKPEGRYATYEELLLDIDDPKALQVPGLPPETTLDYVPGSNALSPEASGPLALGATEPTIDAPLQPGSKATQPDKPISTQSKRGKVLFLAGLAFVAGIAIFLLVSGFPHDTPPQNDPPVGPSITVQPSAFVPPAPAEPPRDNNRDATLILDDVQGAILAGEYDNARSRLTELDALAPLADEVNQRRDSLLAELEAQVKLRGQLEALNAATLKEDWMKAWEVVEQIDSPDPRVTTARGQIIEQLAPKPVLDGPLGIKLVLIRGGAFSMGSDKTDVAKPIHEVTVSDFYLGQYEITSGVYSAWKPVEAEQPDLPIVNVSWSDATAFCRHLETVDSAKAKYRLPSEAEWEYAARGAVAREYPWGNSLPENSRANIEGKSDGHDELAPVGQFRKGATESGLFDMAGNVAEWCHDWAAAYTATPQSNPLGPDDGVLRIVRGGSFESSPEAATAYARVARKPDSPTYVIGFRVVRQLTEQEQKFAKLRDEQ